MNLSRPYGTLYCSRANPALKRRAIGVRPSGDAFGVPATAVQARVAGFPPSVKSNVTVEVGTDHSTRAFPIRHVLRGLTDAQQTEHSCSRGALIPRQQHRLKSRRY